MTRPRTVLAHSIANSLEDSSFFNVGIVWGILYAAERVIESRTAGGPCGSQSDCSMLCRWHCPRSPGSDSFRVYRLILLGCTNRRRLCRQRYSVDRTGAELIGADDF